MIEFPIKSYYVVKYLILLSQLSVLITPSGRLLVCGTFQCTDEEKKKSTAPGIPRRSPIQVLTGPDVA